MVGGSSSIKYAARVRYTTWGAPLGFEQEVVIEEDIVKYPSSRMNTRGEAAAEQRQRDVLGPGPRRSPAALEVLWSPARNLDGSDE